MLKNSLMFNGSASWRTERTSHGNEEDPQTIMTEETMERKTRVSQSDVDFQSANLVAAVIKLKMKMALEAFWEDNNETTMLIQDDENNSEMSKDWQKEKMCNKINKVNYREEIR